MSSVEEKFGKLATDNAPGQEVRHKAGEIHSLIRGEKLCGVPVDFSHGDVDAFEPSPGSLDSFVSGVHVGGSQAYTEYLGKKDVRDGLAEKLSSFTGAPVSGADGLIITPGT